MISKLGSSPFPQRPANVREQSSGINTTDPLAMKKQFGDQNLEEILNTVSDPNYKASKNRSRGVGNLDLDKDAFLKLMLAQLEQQDPTNPLKSHEMAAQLAQFSSVEQLTNINKNIEELGQAQGKQGQYDVLSLIGKQVSGDSSQIDRKAGDKEHIIEFRLPEAAKTAKISIKDAKGIVVREYELNDLKQGKNQLTWNGIHDDGKDARVGEYYVNIDAKTDGKSIKASTKYGGSVDGVQFTSKGPVLTVDGKKLNLKDVQMIQVPEAAQKVGAVNHINPDKEISQGAMEAMASDNSLETANIDRELKNQLSKNNIDQAQ